MPLRRFKNVADAGPDIRILQPTAKVADFTQLTGSVRPAIGDDHLVGIGVDDQIGVVRDDNDLSPLLCRAQPLDKFDKIDRGSRFSSG